MGSLLFLTRTCESTIILKQNLIEKVEYSELYLPRLNDFYYPDSFLLISLILLHPAACFSQTHRVLLYSTGFLGLNCDPDP